MTLLFFAMGLLSVVIYLAGSYCFDGEVEIRVQDLTWYVIAILFGWITFGLLIVLIVVFGFINCIWKPLEEWQKANKGYLLRLKRKKKDDE